MGLKDSAARGVLWSLLQSWGKRSMSLLTFLVLARLLSPGEFGVVALATVFITLVMLLPQSGFAQAIVQREELEDEHLDTALWFSLFLGTLCTLVLLLAASPLSSLLDTPELAPVLRWLSPLFVLGALTSVPSAILQRRLDFKVLALRDTVSTLVGGVVGIAMAVYGFGVYALVGQQLVQALVAVVALWAATTWRPTARFSWPHLRQLYGFGVKVMGIGGLNFVSGQSDSLLIGAFLGNVALGAYAAGQRILNLLTEMFISTISQVTAPTLARLQTQPERMLNALYAATRMASFVSFPIFLGLSALAPEAIQVLIGDQWDAAVPVMRIFGFVGALHAVMFMLGNAFVAAGRPGTSLALGVANAVLNVAAFFAVLALGFGITGVAAAYTLRAYVMAPVHALVARRVLGMSVREYSRSALPAGAAALVMWGAVLATTAAAEGLAAPVRLVIGIGVGAAVYLGLVLLFARDLPREALDFARRAVPRRAGANRATGDDSLDPVEAGEESVLGDGLSTPRAPVLEPRAAVDPTSDRL